MRARFVWLAVPSLSLLFAFAACGSEETVPDGTSPDGSVPNVDATTPTDRDATSSPDAALDAAVPNDGASDGASDAADDADADAAPPPPPAVSCKALHAASPALPSGIYPIDPDGAGPLEAVPVYCDMVFDGGGWTLILSFIAGHSITAPGDAGADASPDASFYLRPPAPNELGMFKGELVQPLAMGATQVHIRSPWAADAGADGGSSAWVSTAVLTDGGTTKPIANLRALNVLNANSGEAFDDWIGPRATAQYLGYEDNGASCSNVNASKYPMVYWACNNTAGLHIGIDTARWAWVNPTTPNEAMEVYVR